jgi:uncharacterized membrane protein (UPF0127 family)
MPHRSAALPWPGLACAALLAAAACTQDQADAGAQRPLRRDALVEIQPSPGAAPVSIAVEVADDPQEHSAGLMHRRLTNDGEGMLFVFQQAAPRAFWMRNTPGSLDLLFLDPQLRLVALIQRTEPMSDRVLRPAAPAQYVIEVPGGFAERHGLRVGAQVRMSRDQAAPRRGGPIDP